MTHLAVAVSSLAEGLNILFALSATTTDIECSKHYRTSSSFLIFFCFFLVAALKNLLTGDQPPNKVIDKSLDSISNYNVLQRDDSMVLYAPPIQPESPASKSKLNYEIILYRPVSENVNSSYR